MVSLDQYFKNVKTILPPKIEKLEMKNKRRTGELLEFQKFGDCEPSHIFSQMVKDEVPGDKRSFANMMKIAERPGHSEEVIGQLHKKFKDSKRADELDGLLEAQYDPLGPFAELQNLAEQIKIAKMAEDNKKAKLEEIARHVVIAAVLMLVAYVIGEFAAFAKMQEINPILTIIAGLAMKMKEIDLMITIIAILLWHMVQEFLEIKVIMAFTRSELMRIRASCTTGNLVQLLMRTELKLNYIERRSMKFYAKVNDFYRFLQEEFLDQAWRDLSSGEEKFGSLVAEFIEGKIYRGLKINELTEDEKNEFTKTLQECNVLI
jgi:hypothetical protein